MTYFIFDDDPDTLHFITSVKFDDGCYTIWVNSRSLNWLSSTDYQTVKKHLIIIMSSGISIIKESVLFDSQCMTSRGDPVYESIKDLLHS